MPRLDTHHTTSLIFNDSALSQGCAAVDFGAFTPRKLAEFEALIEGIVDRFPDRVEDFAKVVPSGVISFMLGLPEEHRAQLRGHSLAIPGALDPVMLPKASTSIARSRQRTATPRFSPSPTAWTSRASPTGISPASMPVLARRWRVSRGRSREGRFVQRFPNLAQRDVAGAVPGLCQPANPGAIAGGMGQGNARAFRLRVQKSA
ncbi:hypothetical protein [Ponticoccus alexandrii]|uniref:Uncharacterized protein n=1 Tax=Ponticoccus alexandrii TaxID=1943633 RepID=A0ABX7FBH3_9RHOB|nr:hypothetical protein [Ponticoccus alexandrii]QRF67834.1 hypothetical protein GQA70_16905 [Ponticoccus alexandrii]